MNHRILLNSLNYILPSPRNQKPSYATGLVLVSETIAVSTWNTLKQFQEHRIPMPPTCVFRCRALLYFAAVGELMSLIIPDCIHVSMQRVLDRAQFTEYYCACGKVSKTEKEFLDHLGRFHLIIQRLVRHFKVSHLTVH